MSFCKVGFLFSLLILVPGVVDGFVISCFSEIGVCVFCFGLGETPDFLGYSAINPFIKVSNFASNSDLLITFSTLFPFTNLAFSLNMYGVNFRWTLFPSTA